MPLRPYQAHARDQADEFMARRTKRKNGLIVQPTGSGKAHVIAAIAQSILRRGSPCLVFQPTKEILLQNAQKLCDAGEQPKVFSASMNQREIGDLTLATIGTAIHYKEAFRGLEYVLVDEAHLVNAEGGQYAEFIAALGNPSVIGLTATPYRLAHNNAEGSVLRFLTRTRPKIFTDVISYEQVPTLVQAGFLMKPTYQVVRGFTRRELAFNTRGSDFTDESVRRYYKRVGFDDRLRRVMERLRAVGRRSVLVFTRFVDDAHRLADVTPGMAVVSEATPDAERAALIAAFRSGELWSIANVNVLGIGFDHPGLDTVVQSAPTVSLTRHYQQVGRVLRVDPSGVKTDAWVVDMVDQMSVFGAVDRLWLRPGGKRGGKWEVVGGHGRVLTNVPLDPSRRFWRGNRKRKESATQCAEFA